ncbi:MAG: serine--tRNA ligase [Patescibacteria group bacterium]
MLDIKFIRENPDVIKDVAVKKGIDPGLVDQLLGVDSTRREFIQLHDEFRSAQKKATNREEGAGLKEKIKTLEADPKYAGIEERFNRLAVMMPSIISPDTPIGKSDADNKEVYSWGEPRKFSFTPKDHIQLGKDLDILDLERGTKVGGFRGYYVKNDGVLLVMGIMLYAIHKMVKRGYAPMIPPTLVKEFALFGSGYFKGLEYDPGVDEIYQVATPDKELTGEVSREKKFLVGTAEPSLLAYYSGEILKIEDLPLKMCGYSQCYRSEIGSYGKEVKGIYRVHEFMKVEQVVFAEADIEKSNKIQEEMTGISGEMHEEMGLPYRRLQICSGDMSPGKYRAFDLEAWLPGMNRWAETGSASNFLDWQARRLNVKYVDKKGEKKFVYMLNNTALPSPRVFIAILENYQNEKGEVEIPEVLQPYVGKKIISSENLG